MRVLVTGISGFIGCHLAGELQDAGFEVRGLAMDRDDCGLDAEILRIDVTDEAALGGALAAWAPDVIVHLAGLSHVGESWSRPADYYRVNFLGTRNVLRAAASARVIVASSAEVYGFVPEDEQPFAEDRELDPRSPYAITKACAEALAFAEGAIVLRAFPVVGAGQ